MQRGRNIAVGAVALVVAMSVAVAPLWAVPAAAQAPSGFNDDILASGLLEPTAFASAPDGRVFVTEQSGAVKIVRAGQDPVVFTTLPVDHDLERGLLGIALHPQFASNGWVYVYWTDPTVGFAHRISRFVATGDNAGPRDDRVLLDPHAAGNHNGGAIHFGPDGMLYVATGDNAVAANAQTLSNRHGKILRYTDSGGIPADNPFVSQADGANDAIFAVGFRNPFTFAFGPGGKVYVNDVGSGSDGEEEINQLVAGGNFGWPIREGAGPGPEPSVPPLPGTSFTDPVYFYGRDQGCAITGGAFYTGTQFPAPYQGDYFFGDYCGDWIRRLGAPTENFVPNAGAAVDFISHPNGSLLYLSYNSGAIHVLTYGAQVAPTITIQPADVTYLPGEALTFTVGATGTQPLLYQWQAEAGGAWTNVAGANSPSITVATQPGIGVSRHRVVVSNSAGTVVSNAASATETTSAITISNPPRGSQYEVGQALAVAATGVDAAGQALGLEWRVVFHHDLHIHPALDWQPLGPASAFTVPNQAHDPGVYWYRFEVRATLPGGNQVVATRDVFRAGSTSRFAPGSPRRIVDTRTALGGTRLVAGAVLEVALPPPVPDAATAVNVNLTSDGAASDGYLTAWPCGQLQPPTSTVNYVAGAPAAAGALVGIGGGKLCVYAYTDTDVIVDISGWADPYPTTTRTAAAIGPVRLVDTRSLAAPLPAGGTHLIDVAGVVAGAAGHAVALNVTAVDAAADGYVTLWACDQPMPATSNLNVRAGETRPNLAIVPVDGSGHVCAFSYGGGHLVVDAVGAFLPGSGGAVQPVAPVRLLDTRSGGAPLAAGGTVAVAAPAGAKAVAVSLVATEAEAAGYLTAYACGASPPLASNVNYLAGQTIANGAIAPVGADGAVCVTTYAATHVVVDLTGVFT